MKTKTTLSFTAEELDVLYYALNAYALEQMETSKTWGNVEEMMKRGGHDVWGQTAMKAGHLQSRTYKARLRFES